MGWDQATLAREMGTEQNRLQHWLTGRNKTMKSKYAWPLQDKYRWNARWLLDGEGVERLPAPDPEKERIIEDLRSLPTDRLKAIRTALSV